MKRWIFSLVLFLATPLAAEIEYEVHFTGVEEGIELLLRSASQLITLQDCPPATQAALKRRAEAEIPRLIQMLHSRAFYDASIQLTIDYVEQPARVFFAVSLGPAYSLVKFCVLSSKEIGLQGPTFTEGDKKLTEAGDLLALDLLAEEPWQVESSVQNGSTDCTDRFEEYSSISLEELGIELYTPAWPQKIVDAEEMLIEYLHEMGYPFAEQVKREVIADQKEKSVEVWLYVDSGPLAYFGPTTITGLKHVRQKFVRRKIAWEEGATYDPDQLQETFEALDASGLFVNIQITPDASPEGEASVPITIDLSEGKQRSIAFGGSYATQQGGGALAEWEHRNMRGMGERLSLKAELMQRLQSGSATYAIPNFLRQGQELLTRAEAQRDETLGFTDTSLMLSSRVNRRYWDSLLLSGGLAIKYLKSSDSDNNRPYTLVKVPLQLIYNDTGSPLDPIEGVSLNLRFTPTLGIIEQQIDYYIATIDMAFYYPLNRSKATVLATRLHLGSILGASRISVPPPERFYAGSQQLLRGYRWMTVSPLNADNKPIGGRSLAIFSLEIRHRLGENWGAALFYDVGNVYASTTPELLEKQLQAVGVGARYYTPLGPLRLDIAFPLNRRSIDGRFQVYFSIGQAF